MDLLSWSIKETGRWSRLSSSKQRSYYSDQPSPNKDVSQPSAQCEDRPVNTSYSKLSKWFLSVNKQYIVPGLMMDTICKLSSFPQALFILTMIFSLARVPTINIFVFSKLYSVKILPISLKIALNNRQKYFFCNLTGGFSPVKLRTLSWPLNFHHQNLNFQTNSVSKY